MNTPIADFIARYVKSGISRLHMPGHKGAGAYKDDITEILGADELYSPDGIILESEQNAARLFGSRRTLYSTEGSTQCIKAMLHIALINRRDKAHRPVCLAARNAHKALIYAAALQDFDIDWLYPEGGALSPCSCPVTPEALQRKLSSMGEKPFCVYITSPDYLGGMQDIRGLSEVCHRCDIPLLVDNAHGAYLRFLENDLHPLTLGADMCSDSAHKTLNVLTGGAYLHISPRAPAFAENAKDIMALYGSTSPSYLILKSLDEANRYLAGDFRRELDECAKCVKSLKKTLSQRGYRLIGEEPIKLALLTDGPDAAKKLRSHAAEPEYIDKTCVVMMFTPQNKREDYTRVLAALEGDEPSESPALAGEEISKGPAPERQAPPAPGRRLTIREAGFAQSETVPVSQALGRICASPTVSCPPAVPICVSGEEIDQAAITALKQNGISNIAVVKE